MSRIQKIGVKKLSVWWRGRCKMRRNVSVVSMAASEYCSCSLHSPTLVVAHVAFVFEVSHMVTLPRWASARLCAG
jgi:hypothetical protein